METLRSAELLATPIRTDADVLARVAAVIDEEARRLRALWLFFLDRDGLQNELVVPVDCIPDLPDPGLAGSLCYIVTQLLNAAGSEGAESEGAAIITLSRPGGAELGETDLRWLRALQQGAAAHRSPIRMLCLATPGGVRELGPVSTAA